MKKKFKFLSALLLVFVFMLTPFIAAGCSLVEEVNPPTINISDDGYWVINGEKTGVKASGEKGDSGNSPYINPDDGYWYIGTTKTLYKAQGDDGIGIVSIVKTGTEGNVDTYTITYSDSTEQHPHTDTFTVRNGEKGDPGNGIAGVAKTGTNGNEDTYTITFTNGTTQTFNVTNGTNGQNGVGIRKIEKTETNGLEDTYTITYTDSTEEVPHTDTFTVRNGQNGTTPAAGRDGVSVTGAQVNDYGDLIITLGTGANASQINAGKVKATNGTDGIGITGITKTGEEGLVDTYTVTYTSGEPTVFTITNGRGIEVITGPESDGNVDTYTIHYTDGTTSTFTVTNGTNGQDATYATYTVEFNYHGMENLFDFSSNNDETIEEIQVKTTEWLKGKFPQLKTEYKGFLLGWYIRGTNVKLSDYNFIGGDVTLEPIFDFNTYLNITREYLGSTHNTLQDVVDELKSYDIDIVAYDAAFDTDHTRLVWDSVNDQFYLYIVDENTTDTLKAKQTVESSEINCFAIYHEDDYEVEDGVVDLTGEISSVYFAQSDNLDGVTIWTNKGVDVGENTNIAEVNYHNVVIAEHPEDFAQTVTIRTNGGVLNIYAPYDTVNKYGTAETVNITAVAGSSYHEFGTTGLATIAEGRIVVTETAQVGGIHVVASEVENGEEGETEFKPVILKAEANAQIPNITRDEVTVENGESKKVFEMQIDMVDAVTGETETSTARVYISKEADVESAVIKAVEINDSTGEEEETLVPTNLDPNDYPEVAVAVMIAEMVEESKTAEEAKTEADKNITFVSTEAELRAALEAEVKRIVLNADITLSTYLFINRDLILDLNGKTITANGAYAVVASGEGVTVTVTGDGAVVGSNDLMYSQCGATLVIKNGTYTSTGNSTFVADFGGNLVIYDAIAVAQEPAIFVERASSATIYGGTFTANDNFVVGTNGTKKTGDDRSGSTINIYGGTFNGNIQTAGYVACGIYAANDDTITVNSGRFYIDGGVGIVARAGNITLGEDVLFIFVNTNNLERGWVGDNKNLLPVGEAIVVDFAAAYPGYDAETFSFTNESGYDAIALVKTEEDIAVALAQDINEVVLMADVDFTAQVVIEKDVTIDLNGHTATYVSETLLTKGLFGVKRGATLTVNDSVGTGRIDATSDKIYAAISLTLPGENDPTDAARIIVNGGTIEGYYYAITGNGTRHNTEIVVNDGTLYGVHGTAIYNPQDGSVEINGGHFVGLDTAIEIRAGELVINDGEFEALSETFSTTANGSGTTIVGSIIAVSQHSTLKNIDVTINGGTFTNGIRALSMYDTIAAEHENLMNVTINGGTFNSLVANAQTSTIVVSSGNLTINGGDFNSGADDVGDGCSTVYAINNGHVTINGGTFKAGAKYDGRYWTLNVHNKSNTTASMEVLGGTYYDFDPSNPKTDDSLSYLAEGYTVSSETVEDVTVYTVVEED